MPLRLGMEASGVVEAVGDGVTHISTRETTQTMADDLFAAVVGGNVKIRIDQRYPLSEVQQAHRDLEARKTTGCSILTL